MMASENIQTHSQVKYITSKYFMQLSSRVKSDLLNSNLY